MADIKMIEAIVICTILSALVFRTHYFANVKVSRARYTEKGKFDYGMLWLDILTVMSYSIIGCYLAWDSIGTNPAFDSFKIHQTPASILIGLVFQQALPIAIELVMNKINSYKPKKSGR